MRGTFASGWGYGVRTMRAALTPHLSPIERRALALLALAGGPFAALTAVAVSVVIGAACSGCTH